MHCLEFVDHCFVHYLFMDILSVESMQSFRFKCLFILKKKFNFRKVMNLLLTFCLKKNYKINIAYNY